MATTNRDSVLRYFELVDANRHDELYDLYDDAIEYRRAGVATIHGKEGLVAFFEGPRGIARIRHDVEIVADVADVVVVEGRARAELVDGGGFDLRFADFFWFRQGLIVRRHGYMDIAP